MNSSIGLALRALVVLTVFASAVIGHAASSLVPIQAPRLWQRAEWRIEGAPTARNNFDPDLIRIDGVFTTPSGRSLKVPAFWYQDYQRKLIAGKEILAAKGKPEWRLRFTPDEPGTYTLALTVAQEGRPASRVSESTFLVSADEGSVEANRRGGRGWVLTGEDNRYFKTSDGAPLRLIGANVCWGGERGTFDYDLWFPAMEAAGENFARLWFAPWFLGLEHKPGTLTNYNQADAWQTDYILQLAEKHGIYVLIAMDHHGMFMSNDPAWGGSNNFWLRSSPYSVENGGPSASPNEFFRGEPARKIYQKRLRYLIGRYGYSPRMVSWQFFNEIDNAYKPRSDLEDKDVVEWHRVMGQWLRANDPYRHLVSTSLTGASDRPSIWNLPEMDFTVYHSYGEADPARYVAALSADFVHRYKKPIMIGEIGTNHLRWTIENDPYLRGFRQGLWGGLLGGSVGSSMPWWWEDLHEDRVYPIYKVMHRIMTRAGWYAGTWSPMSFVEGEPAPIDLDEAQENAAPFDADIALNQLRLNPVSGEAAIADPLAAQRAAERISSYLHGSDNRHLQQHARLTAWFADGARLVLRVNSVASDADLIVRVDGKERLRVPLFNKDKQGALNDEINQEFAVTLPAGKRRIEITHTGRDWVNLKSLRLESVLPSTFTRGWQFRSEAIGLRSESSAVVYVRSPNVAWPAGAKRYNPPLRTGETVTVKGWNDGAFTAAPKAVRVTWFDPVDGRELPVGGDKRSVNVKDGQLTLALPEFSEDVLGIIEAVAP